MHSGIVVLLITFCMIWPGHVEGIPRFLSSTNTFFVMENETIGYLIATEGVEDDGSGVDSLIFDIRGDGADYIELVQSDRGEQYIDLKLKKTVDADIQINPGSAIVTYAFTLTVTNNSDSVSKFCSLYVSDVNDNAPTFLNQPYRVDVPEDAEPGTSIYRISAEDVDTNFGGALQYFLNTQDVPFAVGSGSGVITLTDHLDYASRSFYQLTVNASDLGVVRQSSIADLVVNVIDVQGEPPYFVNLPYLQRLQEDASIGQTVLQVTALDGDIGNPNSMLYSLDSGDTEYFNIDEHSGLITVATNLSWQGAIAEQYGVLQLTVMATEDTVNPQGNTTATIPVTVTVEDINNNPPVFTQQTYVGRVPENSPAGIPVTFLPDGTQMVVVDADQGDNSRFQLFLESNGEPFDVFEVIPSHARGQATVLLTVKNETAVDFEKSNMYQFQIVAREIFTAEQHTTRADVTIQVQDMNDHYPVFSEDFYEYEIPENSPRGTLVATITATDSDSGDFSNITYSIRGSSAHLFAVNSSSGAISVAVDADIDHNLLDREKLDRYFLTYEAQDGGGMRTAVQVEVVLTDVNDNQPRVFREEYHVYVVENEAEPEIPASVEATDVDLGASGTVHYRVLPEAYGVAINSTSGDIVLNSQLDYEALQRLSGEGQDWDGELDITGEAYDLGVPSLSASLTLVVHVLDYNDETPVFLQDSYQTVISEAETSGFSVTTVSATDADGTAPNNAVLYRIDSGARDTFRVDANSGVITVDSGATLDRDRAEQYTLIVLAIDRGTPANTGTTTVHINVTDINNKPPVFRPDRNTVYIYENTTIDTVVFVSLAQDPDLDSSLVYSILGDRTRGEDGDKLLVTDTQYLNSLFTIDSSTGAVRVAHELDRETVEEVTLTVGVTDVHAAPQYLPQTATSELTVRLLDINDNSPRFIPGSVYYARISEASSPGVEVKQVQAVDDDIVHTSVYYYLVNDSVQSQSFEIRDSSTGLITLLHQVDYESGNTFNLTVLAQNTPRSQPGHENAQGTPTDGVSTATVVVELEDVNDENPEWSVFQEFVPVMENVTVETVITQVQATDGDSGDYGRVTYHITGGDDGVFGINTTSGEVFVQAPLDRELTALYSLTIESRDNPGAPLSQQRKTSSRMVISVQDINDSPPVFEQPSYAASVQENAVLHSTVTTVRANDADYQENGEVRYGLDTANSNSTVMFRVEPATGSVVVGGSLQGHVGVYVVSVFAIDAGASPLSSTVPVYVTVQDVNDHIPRIIHPGINETQYIRENAPVGTAVTQVVALDEDTGVNGEVMYRLDASGRDEDWRMFSIDETTGVITTATVIDREMRDVYYLDVRAYNEGEDDNYEARRIIIIEVIDHDDNDPVFSRAAHPPPYVLQTQEERAGVVVGNLSLAEDPDSGNNSIICYYIVGGDEVYRHYFILDRHTGMLTLNQSLDHESTETVDLVIQANRDCRTMQWEDSQYTPIAWNASDISLLWVEVQVGDVNDNPPRFRKEWFTAGVTRDTQVGEPVIELMDYTSDSDSAEYSIAQYYIHTPIQMTDPLDDQIRSLGKPPFVLDTFDGVIRTNVYFQHNMQGYFQFQIYVNNSLASASVPSAPEQFYDVADVSIYLLNENQRVIVIIRGRPEDVGKFKDEFAEFISNITGAIINVDKIRTHKDGNGVSDDRRTDMFIHAIYPESGEVYDAKDLLDLIDQKYSSLVDLFNSYNVIKVVLAVEEESEDKVEDKLLLAMIVVAASLLLIIVILIIAFCMCRRKYKRQLKSANAMAFEPQHPTLPVTGPHENGLTTTEIPTTNIHMYEGSNPIWQERYDTSRRQSESDSYRFSSESSLNNSISENTGVPDPAQEQSNQLYDEKEMTIEMYDDEINGSRRRKAANPALNGGNNHAPLNNHTHNHLDAMNHRNSNPPPASPPRPNGDVLATTLERHQNSIGTPNHHPAQDTPTLPVNHSDTLPVTTPPSQPAKPPPKSKSKNKPPKPVKPKKGSQKKNGDVINKFDNPIDAYDDRNSAYINNAFNSDYSADYVHNLSNGSLNHTTEI